MLLVENRGYQLILRERNAFRSTLRITSKVSLPKIFWKPSCARKQNAFKEKIRMHLAWYCAPSTSRYYGEQLEVIYAYVRRAVYKDASLTFLSHSYGSVMALL
ncbi:hypothetical protein EV363DRAFT_1340292, partial [Boletus edulis]